MRLQHKKSLAERGNYTLDAIPYTLFYDFPFHRFVFAFLFFIFSFLLS